MSIPRHILSTVAVVTCLAALSACGGANSPTQDAVSSPAGPTSAGPVAPEPATVTVGESFSLSGNSYGQGAWAGMTFTITDVDTAPQCEQYDSASGDYVLAKQDLIAIAFDVSTEAGSAPMSFGSPDWFRAKDPDGYVTDELTIMAPSCDDIYPDFTDAKLMAGDKHRGWVMLQTEKIQPGDQLIIQWPYSTTTAVFTIPQ